MKVINIYISNRYFPRQKAIFRQERNSTHAEFWDSDVTLLTIAQEESDFIGC